MGRALASPAASSADSPAAPRTPTSCRRSSDQHRIAVPPPACLNPQSEPHVVPSRRVPRASSLALARIRQRLSDCRIFTPAQPNHSVASSEGFLLRRLVSVRRLLESAESLGFDGAHLDSREGLPLWTDKNRARYDRDHLRYPSDLTDDEWA